jgi:hypothetical protein
LAKYDVVEDRKKREYARDNKTGAIIHIRSTRWIYRLLKQKGQEAWEIINRRKILARREDTKPLPKGVVKY